MIYEAVGRLAVQNFKAAQMVQLKECQERFRAAISRRDPDAMVVENNRFHAIIGEMANSAFLKPTLSKLLIDHARIGYTFFRPTDDEMEASLAKSCEHHDQFIQAIAEKGRGCRRASRVRALGAVALEHGDVHRAQGPEVGGLEAVEIRAEGP